MGEHPGQKVEQIQRPKGRLEMVVGIEGMKESSPSESKKTAREVRGHNRIPGQVQ